MSFSRHWVLGVPVDDATEADVLRVVQDRVRSTAVRPDRHRECRIRGEGAAP